MAKIEALDLGTGRFHGNSTWRLRTDPGEYQGKQANSAIRRPAGAACDEGLLGQASIHKYDLTDFGCTKQIRLSNCVAHIQCTNNLHANEAHSEPSSRTIDGGFAESTPSWAAQTCAACGPRLGSVNAADRLRRAVQSVPRTRRSSCMTVTGLI
jgi:hypothetical protein